MKKIFSSIICVFCVTCLIKLSAQNAGNQDLATLNGVVLKKEAMGSVVGATVHLKPSGVGSICNGKGQFTIDKIKPGTYMLIVSCIGYETVEKEISLKPNESQTIDFELVESISILKEVTVITGGSAGVKEIPGAVTYISPKEIEKFAYTDINRTLRSVPGINLQEEDGFGLRPNIGLRGTGAERSSKITVMEDGILMAPAPYAAPAAYYFPTIGRMQGVEIMKGSSQIKYGPYTTGGAINLISTQIPYSFSGRVYLMGGSFGGRNMHATVGNSHKNVGYMVETYQYGSEGFKILDNGGNTGFDKKDYLAKVRVNTNPTAKIYQSLTFKVGQVNEVSNETYVGLTQDDFNTNPLRRYAGSQMDQMNTSQMQYSMTHTIGLTRNLDIKTTLYRSDFSRNWYKLDKLKDSTGSKTSISTLLENPEKTPDAFNVLKGQSSSNADAFFVKANNRAYYGQGIQSAIGIKFKTGLLAHNIDVGIRVHQDQMDRFQWEDQYAMLEGKMLQTKKGTPGTESNRIERADAIATYLQYKLRYNKLTIIPGVRHENIAQNKKDYGKSDPERHGTKLKESNNFVNVLIPGLGMDYKFNPYFQIFSGLHQGFAPPGSNDDAVPEESVNYELGTRFEKHGISGQAVIFYNDYKNLLGSDLAAAGGAGSGNLYNAGQVRAQGLEFQVTYNLLSNSKVGYNLPVSVVYTNTDAVFLNSFDSEFEGWGKVEKGDKFPYLAQNQFTILVGLENEKFSLNLSGRYMDEMRTAPGQGAIPDQEKTDSYFVLDASANYAVHQNIGLFMNATNITDQVYVVARRPAGLRPGMPAAFNVGLRATF